MTKKNTVQFPEMINESTVTDVELVVPVPSMDEIIAKCMGAGTKMNQHDLFKGYDTLKILAPGLFLLLYGGNAYYSSDAGNVALDARFRVAMVKGPVHSLLVEIPYRLAHSEWEMGELINMLVDRAEELAAHHGLTEVNNTKEATTMNSVTEAQTKLAALINNNKGESTMTNAMTNNIQNKLNQLTGATKDATAPATNGATTTATVDVKISDKTISAKGGNMASALAALRNSTATTRPTIGAAGRPSITGMLSSAGATGRPDTAEIAADYEAGAFDGDYTPTMGAGATLKNKLWYLERGSLFVGPKQIDMSMVTDEQINEELGFITIGDQPIMKFKSVTEALVKNVGWMTRDGHQVILSIRGVAGDAEDYAIIQETDELGRMYVRLSGIYARVEKKDKDGNPMLDDKGEQVVDYYFKRAGMTHQIYAQMLGYAHKRLVNYLTIKAARAARV